MSASTTQSTTISKGRDGWEARTTIGMGVSNRVLIIDTHKTQGGVVTNCMVNTERDGFLSWNIFGDFSKRSMFRGVRCCEKTVRSIHEQALFASDLTMSEAAAFYAKKDAKDQADNEVEAISDPMDDFNYVGSPMHY
jgi:hypothetical protein